MPIIVIGAGEGYLDTIESKNTDKFIGLYLQIPYIYII